MLDIAFREDESHVRQGNADQNLAVLRRLALNLLRQDTTAKMGIKANRLKAGWDHAYLLAIFGRPSAITLHVVVAPKCQIGWMAA